VKRGFVSMPLRSKDKLDRLVEKRFMKYVRRYYAQVDEIDDDASGTEDLVSTDPFALQLYSAYLNIKLSKRIETLTYVLVVLTLCLFLLSAALFLK